MGIGSKCIGCTYDCKYSKPYCPDFEQSTSSEHQKSFRQNATNHAEHYSFGSIECIDAIKACMSKEEYQGFLKGNVFKYLWRYKLKGGADDLDKASVYLAWLRESYGEGEQTYGQ